MMNFFQHLEALMKQAGEDTDVSEAEIATDEGKVKWGDILKRKRQYELAFLTEKYPKSIAAMEKKERELDAIAGRRRNVPFQYNMSEYV